MQLNNQNFVRLAGVKPVHTPSSPHLRSIPNNLWLARKRLGLSQKWVAILLGRRSVSIVSEYERGFRTPPLPVALKLQVIYKTPMSELFPTLQSSASAEVASILEKHPYMVELEKRLNTLPDYENA